MHLDALNGMLSEANGTVSSTSSEHTQLERAKRNVSAAQQHHNQNGFG